MRQRTIKIPGIPDNLSTPCRCIYALRDPDTNEVRYVGYTSDVHNRYWHHIQTYQNKHNPELLAWIQGVLAAGKMPICEILERVENSFNTGEAEWIRKFYKPGVLLNRSCIWGTRNSGHFLVKDA